MKIDIEFPNFLMYKLLKAQADLSGVDLNKASEETFLDLIAHQNKRTDSRTEE